MRHILALSGGKDSTALAIHVRNTRPDVPVEYVFADTGRELPGVYEFLDKLESVIGPIHRICGGWYCPSCKEQGTTPTVEKCPSCGHIVTKRDMDFYMDRWSTIESGPYLPSAQTRWCTNHLKLRPFDRFVGRDECTIYIGLRADEQRDGNYGYRPNVTYRYPFREDGIGIDGVMEILNQAGVELPGFYRWRHTGGCWCCPFQRPEDWMGLRDNHPELFERASEEESESAFHWSCNHPGMTVHQLAQLGEEKQRQGKLFEDDSHTKHSACLICAK